MIVTLTPNTALDYTLMVPGLPLNATVRASAQAWGMAGKAADAAWILSRLGQPVMALGFAAGPLGKRMEQMLLERGVRTDFTWVGGETRLNVVLVCQGGSGQSTFTAPSLKVSPEHIIDLQKRYEESLPAATCVVLGGTLPGGVPVELYPRLIAQARRRGIPVIFDASGPGLQAGLSACPSLVKPNRDELGELLGKFPVSPDETFAACRQLQKIYGVDVVATSGEAGAIAALGDTCYRIHPLDVPVVSAAGAGDGVLAGLALALANGEPQENGLRYGFALAGAIVQTLATADFRLEDYQALLPKVVIEMI